jgi:hypothetical protein
MSDCRFDLAALGRCMLHRFPPPICQDSASPYQCACIEAQHMHLFAGSIATEVSLIFYIGGMVLGSCRVAVSILGGSWRGCCGRGCRGCSAAACRCPCSCCSSCCS